MPELYDGVPESSQWTRLVIPEEWFSILWPRYSIFSYRSMERGFGGHPILLPQTLWPFPRRDAPMFYWNFSLCSSAYFVGVCAGIYVAFANQYITRDLNLEILKHIYFDHQGLEVGGTWRDWLAWIRKDWFNVCRLIRRTIPYAFGGGLLHCFSCFWYRTLFQSSGHMLPMLFTCIVMTAGDLEFMLNYRTMGMAIYAGVAYEFLRLHFLGGNSTFFSYYFFKRYFGDPFCFVCYPPNWVYAQFDRGYSSLF